MSSISGNGHDSRAIANIFVGKSHQADTKLSITQLVKLVYFAHGWTLGYTDKILISDPVEAWQFGPVVPVVYNTFRPQGILISAPAINDRGQPYVTDVNDVEFDIISNVYTEYSGLSPFELSALTHEENTPWAQYDGMHYHTIDNDHIWRHYKERVRKLEQAGKLKKGNV